MDLRHDRQYKRTGRFPDGTVTLKELVLVGSTPAVSGNGYFMGEFVGLEATIKDSKRFPNEPGHWAYFSFGHAYPLADAAEPFPAAAWPSAMGSRFASAVTRRELTMCSPAIL